MVEISDDVAQAMRLPAVKIQCEAKKGDCSGGKVSVSLTLDEMRGTGKDAYAT